jgi:radical SAM superfamily enzyme YgiQ (UPF0313 family)
MKIFNTRIIANEERHENHQPSLQKKILLTSIFGPYARNDKYGSRLINPMELYHNQVTKVQGPFSLRMFHRSCGLKMIQANIQSPCTVLDYPDLDRFVKELVKKKYDIIGISAIPANLTKVEIMCGLIRKHQPGVPIVIGGHISNIENLEEKIDADYVVRGEGIRWFRKFLGEDINQAISHPLILSSINPRCMGVSLNSSSRETAAVLIPSVGCPVGCNFCSTSAMFGGKGHYINFYETGDELFDIMCQLEQEMQVWSFMVMDENFLLHKKRALRLLELMQQHEKSWALYVFSSADVLKSYKMEQLVGLGISWVWIGLEGESSLYGKLENIDTKPLVRELKSNGIRVLGSTIIGLEDHTPENIDKKIEWAVSHKTDFHQFMLYFAPPGTPLYSELYEKGMLFDEAKIELADVHGQYRFNFRHPHFNAGQETETLLKAFQRDFEINGPSVIRMIRTLMDGWLKYKNHPEARVRHLYALQIKNIPVFYAGALWATIYWLKGKRNMVNIYKKLLNDIYREFGFKSRALAPFVGLIVLIMLHREKNRLDGNPIYEPPTFYESSARAVRPKISAVQ